MPKPLIFGDATFDVDRLEALEDLQSNWDNSFVPGYSEARRENDRRRARGEQPIPIPRAQWIPIGNVRGGDIDRRSIFQYARLGYQFVMVDDLKQLGWGMPPAAHVAEDGTIRREDTALAFVGAERADYNAERQRRENEAFHATPAEQGPVEDIKDESEAGKSTLADALRKLNDLS